MTNETNDLRRRSLMLSVVAAVVAGASLVSLASLTAGCGPRRDRNEWRSPAGVPGTPPAGSADPEAGFGDGSGSGPGTGARPAPGAPNDPHHRLPDGGARPLAPPPPQPAPGDIHI